MCICERERPGKKAGILGEGTPLSSEEEEEEEGFRPLVLRGKMEAPFEIKYDLRFELEFELITEEERWWNFRRLGTAPNAITKPSLTL